jgi:hypothetical protein
MDVSLQLTELPQYDSYQEKTCVTGTLTMRIWSM